MTSFEVKSKPSFFIKRKALGKRVVGVSGTKTNSKISRKRICDIDVIIGTLHLTLKYLCVA